MRENIWYTVARTSDKECVGRVLFSIGSTELVFDNLIQFGNISISIVRAAVEADTVFSMRIRSHGGFYYVDIRSSKEYASDPVFSVDQILNTLVALPFAQAGSGKQECIVSTDAYVPIPVEDEYVTIKNVEVIEALKYFSEGLAIGDRERFLAILLGEDGLYISGQKIVVSGDLQTYATMAWVNAKGYITSSALTGYVNGGSYNSTTKYIELKHNDTTVASIDARAFIKDGMVDSVVIEDGYLVITFNTDSGKEPISISLRDIFDPANYYTKTEIMTLLGNYVTLNTKQDITGEKYFSNALAIPLSAPSSPTAGRSYLYSGTGEYAEIPEGGSVADIYDLTIRKNGTSLGTYNLGTAVADINIPIGWGDLTENSAHRFLTDTLINTWDAKQDAISDLATIRAGAALGATALQSETDPVFSASAASGITSDDISAWNAKYDKPSGGIPKSDLATSVQTSLEKADTALQSESDPTVPAWAKKTSLAASDVPTLAISKISGLQDALDGKQPLDADLTAIAALTGSGLLRRNSNNTWSLDTNTYLTSSDHKALTLKVGTITIGSDFNSLAAKTYTITKANLTDTIGSTTYAPYNADGYVPTTRTVNNKPLSGNITLTLDDIGNGSTHSLANYVLKAGDTMTGNLIFNVSSATRNIYYKASDDVNYRAIIFGNDGSLTVGYDGPANSRSLYLDGFNEYLRFGSTKQYSVQLKSDGTIGLSGISAVLPVTNNAVDLGSSNARRFKNLYLSGDILAEGDVIGSGVEATDKLAVPTTAPTSPSSSKTYLWVDDDGNYSEMPLAQFNQLVQNGDFSTNSNWVRAYSGQSFAVANNTLTITCTAAIANPMVYQAVDIANGHKVFYSYYIKVTTNENLTDLRPLMLYPSSQYPDVNITSASLANWTRITGVATATSAKTRIYLGTYNRYSTSKFAIGDTIQLRNVWFTDLTEAYGAGNEPTAEQFQAAYPADYYDYQPIGS